MCWVGKRRENHDYSGRYQLADPARKITMRTRSVHAPLSCMMVNCSVSDRRRLLFTNKPNDMSPRRENAPRLSARDRSPKAFLLLLFHQVHFQQSIRVFASNSWHTEPRRSGGISCGWSLPMDMNELSKAGDDRNDEDMFARDTDPSAVSRSVLHQDDIVQNRFPGRGLLRISSLMDSDVVPRSVVMSLLV